MTNPVRNHQAVGLVAVALLSPAVLRSLYTLGALLIASFLCCGYWLEGPPVPPLFSNTSFFQPQQAANDSISKTSSSSDTLNEDAVEIQGSRTLGAAVLPHQQMSQDAPVLYPAPSLGFHPSVPFTFDPMWPLSAPPNAISLVETKNKIANLSVELYAVDHACTQVAAHAGLATGQPRARRFSPQGGPPPFLQGLQATGKGLLLESSGLYGQSYLREVALKMGTDNKGETVNKRVFHLFRSHFAEGVAPYFSPSLQRLLLLLLTWRSFVVYAVDYETFECIGTFRAPGIEGWGFASSFDFAIYAAFKQTKQQAATAAAAAAAADARERLLQHASEQRLWATTGGPELLEIPIDIIEAALASNIHYLSAALQQAETQQQQQQQQQQWQQPFVRETHAGPLCRKELGLLRVKRAAIVQCLGRVLVGINELEYSRGRNTLLANLFGLPVVVELQLNSGVCQSLISLSGVDLVEKYHDEGNRVTNGVALPLDEVSSSQLSKLFVGGKHWPYIALVHLRRLREGDDLGFETNAAADKRLCQLDDDTRRTDTASKNNYMHVNSLQELLQILPNFFSTRHTRLWQPENTPTHKYANPKP